MIEKEVKVEAINEDIQREAEAEDVNRKKKKR